MPEYLDEMISMTSIIKKALVVSGVLSAAISHLVAQNRPEGVPEVAVHFEGHYYEEKSAKDVTNGSTHITWDDALKYAQNRGGYLVCIDTVEERNFIFELVSHKQDSSFWLGGFRSPQPDSKELKWYWITGQIVGGSGVQLGKPNDPKSRMIVTSDNNGGRKFVARQTNEMTVDSFVVEYPSGNEVELMLPKSTSTSPTISGNSGKPNGPSPISGMITGNAYSKDIPIKRNQTSVNSLLVMSLGALNAGSSSPMTLIALPADPGKPASLGFNQEVGPSMQKALEEVSKFIQLRFDGWPQGRKLEISFENKYNPKDGPSAAVACALLLESAISGEEIDPGFAVTGDMNADGSVQPIGGIEAKLRGASNRDCTHIGIPVKNLTAVYDAVLMDGISPIMNIQVFSMASFEEAHAISRTEKSEAIDMAFEEFSAIQELYEKQPGSFSNTVRHPKVIEKLSDIVNAAPNHVSASLLLAFAKDSAPKSLSLHGSFSFIDENAYQIVDVIKDGKVAEMQDFDGDQIAEALSLLRRSKLKLDKRTWDWADSLLRWGELLREYQTNRPKAVGNINKLVDDINDAGDATRNHRNLLLMNPEVMEDLLE